MRALTLALVFSSCGTTGFHSRRDSERSAACALEIKDPVPGLAAGAKRPRWRSYPEPQYPRDAKGMGRESCVILELRVDRAGNVVGTTVLAADEPFINAAVSVAKTASFHPAVLDGVAVPCTVVWRAVFVH
jgi:TonB family protein